MSQSLAQRAALRLWAQAKEQGRVREHYSTGQPKPHSPESLQRKVSELKALGWVRARIAKHLGIAKSTVSRYWS